jgi:AbrB family looped-hinge helix DNA binding protein
MFDIDDIINHMMTATLMKVTKNGQISIPSDVRKRWKTDRVMVFDTPGGLLVRPFDPDAVSRLAGKYKPEAGSPTVDELRRRDREEDAEREEARYLGRP